MGRYICRNTSEVVTDGIGLAGYEHHEDLCEWNAVVGSSCHAEPWCVGDIEVNRLEFANSDLLASATCFDSGKGGVEGIFISDCLDWKPCGSQTGLVVDEALSRASCRRSHALLWSRVKPKRGQTTSIAAKQPTWQSKKAAEASSSHDRKRGARADQELSRKRRCKP